MVAIIMRKKSDKNIKMDSCIDRLDSCIDRQIKIKKKI